MILSTNTINLVSSNIKNIINMDNDEWNKIDNILKIKIIHNLCNKIKNDNLENNSLNLPLKSLKSKKLIQYCGFSKMNNFKLYDEFNKRILEYIFKFRSDYIDKKKRIYYTYNNLSNESYNNLIIGYNDIVYNFLLENKKFIKVGNLYNNLLGNNKEKIILYNDNIKKNEIQIKKNDNNDGIIFYINENIIIVTKLTIISNLITNNIPALYIIKLINNY